MNRGIAYALFTYLFWGMLPIYWKLLQHVPSLEIVSHRVFWSFIFFIIFISFRRGWKELIIKIKSDGNKWLIFAPAILIGVNWFTYIWAVTSDHVIETSLGYFISPLISVFLGVVFLKENLRRFQWAAVSIAALGVLIMTFVYGQFPWIAILLAGTWGTYGLLRKKSPLNSIEGLTLETGILVFPVSAYIIYLLFAGDSHFTINLQTSLLLACTGIMGGVPLLVYITAARMINLSLLGILQYIYPTIIFLLGVFVYNEILNEGKIIGFAFIWIALAVYSIDGTYFLRRKKLAAAAE